MADVKNYAVTPTDLLIEQIDNMANSIAYNDSKIRIQPDGHPGKGAVIGSTITYTDKIIPSTVGVDIACRVSLFKVPKNIDFEKLDAVIHEHIPTGFAVRDKICWRSDDFPYAELHCWEDLNNKNRLMLSMGSLGAGNHMIALDKNTDTGEIYLCIHTGSRNLGKQACEYYQKKAEDYAVYLKNCIHSVYDNVIRDIKSHAQEYAELGINLGERIQREIQHRNEDVERLIPQKGMEYITGQDLADYLDDMELINMWSYDNHMTIAKTIGQYMGFDVELYQTCIHNYVDVDNGIIRKGAISAQEGEIGIIPLNMRDGVLIVKGKGNPDWNYSLPHGAGRLMGRGEARKQLSMDDFKQAMSGIYTTCVQESTLDEAPMAYKDAQSIIAAIEPNAEIIAHLQEIYNFKATN